VKFWCGAGAKCINIFPEKHDEFTALTSHLPHLISFCFAEHFCRFEKKHSDVRDAAAGSFESITRIAKSSPFLWSEIFAQNRFNMLKHACNFRKCFDKMLAGFENKSSALTELKKISRDYEKFENKSRRKNKRNHKNTGG
ncbi:prephenate dehydrogenase, partial [bacterium]|nr:prephenate dehydrogenase [bacterium]